MFIIGLISGAFFYLSMESMFLVTHQRGNGAIVSAVGLIVFLMKAIIRPIVGGLFGKYDFGKIADWGKFGKNLLREIGMDIVTGGAVGAILGFFFGQEQGRAAAELFYIDQGV